MNLYECTDIEQEVERIAAENDGEVPEEKMQAMILANTTAITSVEKLCNYIAVLNGQTDVIDNEIKRLQRMKKSNDNRVESIKRYLAPWLSQKGGKLKVGTWNLGIKKGYAVQLADNFKDMVPADMVGRYLKIETVCEVKKREIAEDLKAGKEVPGAVIVISENLTIR